MCSKTKKVEGTTRKCSVCGTFYPSNKEELAQEIKIAFQQAKLFSKEDISALVVPHAGYIFSADVAATSYATLHRKYKNIFIIGSSHHINFNGISIYNGSSYQTPLGNVAINTHIVQELKKRNKQIVYKEEAHNKEHTIEVQLPFLQTLYGDELQIVPIIVASSELETITALAKTLQPYFDDEQNLFIISTDLSHYPSYKDANKVDQKFLNALKSNNPVNLIENIIKTEELKVQNLQTSACGWSSLLSLLYLTQNANYTYETLKYKNSGDSKYGDKDRVVGYGAMRIYKNNDLFSLTEEEKKELKEIAKLALYEAVLKNEKISIDTRDLSDALKEHLGAFVTFHYKGALKGCIGRFEPNQELWDVVVDMTIAASRYDTRFTPISKEDLPDIEIEISVLTPRKRVQSIDDIVLGKDGIYVEYGNKNGTYLPQVATDMKWSAEEFFKSCCEEKAGISSEKCKDAKLYTYEAIIF